MRRRCWRTISAGTMLAAMLGTNIGCSRELTDALVSGLAAYVGDATYGLLAEWLPFPLGDAPDGNGGGDPFSDPPLQL